MKFGLFYLFSDFGDIPQDQIFNEVLEEIEYGEELGFDSVWLPEHPFCGLWYVGQPADHGGGHITADPSHEDRHRNYGASLSGTRCGSLKTQPWWTPSAAEG